MKIIYDIESDILMFKLSQAAPVDAIEEPGGVIISYGENGKPVSIEFLNASVKKLVNKGEINVTFPASSGVLTTY